MMSPWCNYSFTNFYRASKNHTLFHKFKESNICDGCAGQSKEKKNIYNLCMHKKEFGLDAVWNYFATSHGKSPCDGIRGTVERVTARACYRDQSNLIFSNA